MKNSATHKLGIFLIIFSIITILLFLKTPSNVLQPSLLIVLFFVVLLIPFLNIRRLIEPISPFALMYSGLGTSAIRLLIDTDYPRLLTLNGITSVDAAIEQLVYVLPTGTLALIMLYIGYFGINLRIRKYHLLSQESSLKKSIYTVVFWLTVIGLLAFGYIIQTGGGIAAFIMNPTLRSSFSQQNAGISGSFYWFLIADLMMLANIIWYSHDPKAFRNPLYLSHLLAVSALRMSMGSRYPVITFWIALFVIYIIHNNNKHINKVSYLLQDKLPTNNTPPKTTLFRWPIMRTLLLGIVMLVFALLILAVRNASSSGIFNDQAFQTTIQDVFSPLQILRLISGHDLVDVDIMMLIQRDFGNRHSFFLGKTFLELPLMPIPRFIWHEKPELLGRWIGQNYLYSNTTGVPAGITGELYMNFGLVGMLAGMFIVGIFLRWIWENYKTSLASAKMICLYAIVFARFIPSLTASGLTNATIYYLSFLIPTLLVFSFSSYKNATPHQSVVALPSNPSNVNE